MFYVHHVHRGLVIDCVKRRFKAVKICLLRQVGKMGLNELSRHSDNISLDKNLHLILVKLWEKKESRTNQLVKDSSHFHVPKCKSRISKRNHLVHH